MSESKHRNWVQLVGYYFELSKRAEQRVRDNQRKYGSMSYTELAAKYTISKSKFSFTQRNYALVRSLVLITIATFYFSLPILYVSFVMFHKNHFKKMFMIEHQQVASTSCSHHDSGHSDYISGPYSDHRLICVYK